MLIEQDLILFHLSGLTINCQLFKFSFIFSSGLIFNCQFFSFHFLLYFFLTWTYLRVPVLFIFFFTYLDLPSIVSLIVLWLYHSCLPDWTYTSDARLVDILWKTLICLNYLLPSKGLSEAFIGCKILFRSASLFQIGNKYLMQCVMQCMNVHEWNAQAFFEFFCFLFHLSLFSAKVQMSYANAMIGLTNALCNHCAQICYW